MQLSINSTKFIIVASLLATVVVIVIIGTLFFRKDANEKPPPNPIDKKPTPSYVNNPTPEDLEKETLKTLAENFARIYYSYTWKNFSNIESIYSSMTDRMKSEEIKRVEKMKKEMEGKPDKYFTKRAVLKDSKIAFYVKEKAVVIVNLEIETIAGAIVQKDTMIWVDEKGNRYQGNLDNLVAERSKKDVQTTLIKVGRNWKVEGIEDKS